MSVFSSLFSLVRRGVAPLFQTLLLRTDGVLFCLLFNFRATLRGRDVRFHFDKTKNRYWAETPGRKLYFYHTHQAVLSYRGGVKTRAHRLAKVYFVDRIRFNPGDLIVDCGANVGDLKLYFLEIGLEVEYVGIEPSPREFECLQENVRPSVAYNIGLWKSEGSLNFYVSSYNADSSFIEPPRFDQEVRVETKRLDQIIDRPIKLFKLEAEGAEPEVLEGCERLLPRIEYISADLGFERGVNQESTFVPVANYLLQRNFELVDVSFNRLTALFRNRSFGHGGTS